MKTTLESPTTAAAAAAPAPREAERRQILALVEQFEGMLLTEMLRDVRAGDDEEEGSFGLGGSTMNDMMQSEFGTALSRAGGLGMADMLMKAFARQADAASSGVAPGGLSPAAVPPLAVASSTSDSAGGLTLPVAAVSSKWKPTPGKSCPVQPSIWPQSWPKNCPPLGR